LKTEAADESKLKDFSQQIVDQVFSYGELSRIRDVEILVSVLEKRFNVEEGVAGIPTAFMATWDRASPSSRSDPCCRRHSAVVSETGRRIASR
jgi:aminobenzoyl-glutamate utilization protein B